MTSIVRILCIILTAVFILPAGTARPSEHSPRALNNGKHSPLWNKKQFRENSIIRLWKESLKQIPEDTTGSFSDIMSESSEPIPSMNISSSYDVPDTIIEYSTVGTNRFNFDYDAHGTRIRETAQQWRSPNWVNLIRMTITQDAAGVPLSLLNERWMDTGWVYTGMQVMTNDSLGRIITREHLLRSGEQWQNSRRYYYTYNDLGLIATVQRDDWNIHQWRSSSLTSYGYTSSGVLQIELIENWDGLWWQNVRQTQYYIDGTGSPWMILVQRWAGQDWENITKNLFVNDASGKMLSHTIDQWIGNTWVTMNRKVYVYSSQGDVVSETWETIVNGVFEQSARTIFTYDTQQKLTLKQYEVRSGFQWIPITQLAVEYDGLGRMVQWWSRKWENNNLMNNDIAMNFTINNNAYSYTAYQLNLSYGSVVAVQDGASRNASTSFVLHQNHPNPFNSSSMISFDAPENGSAYITVFNGIGQQVKQSGELTVSAGRFSWRFEAAGLPSGVYYCRVQWTSFGKHALKHNTVNKVMLIR